MYLTRFSVLVITESNKKANVFKKNYYDPKVLRKKEVTKNSALSISSCFSKLIKTRRSTFFKE